MEEVEVTIYSKLPEGEPQGKFEVIVPEVSKIGALIRKICLDNAIPLKSTYILRNKEKQDLHWSSTVRENVLVSGKEFYLWNTAEEVLSKDGSGGCNIWWFIGALSLLIGAAGLIAISVMYVQSGKTVYEYGVVMDAGSSHTTLYVYRWSGEKYKETALANQIYSCKVDGGGISSYVENPKALAPNLKVCLHEAMGVVPVKKHSETPVYLGATAGMRLLDAVNSSESNAILDVVRATIELFPFKFSNATQQARIISGEEEGLYSWVTSNYITGAFGVKPPHSLRSGKHWQLSSSGEETVGAMDLGGASTQMTFYPGNVDIPNGYDGDLLLYGMNYSVYTHSYLCFGINEITRKFQAALIQSQGYQQTVMNPCGPKGKTVVVPYRDVFEAPCTKDSRPSVVDKNTNFQLVGGSNSDQCHSLVQKLFNFDTLCTYPSCSFDGVFQPAVYGHFYAFSNFYYEMSFLNLTSPKLPRVTTLAAFKNALTGLCGKSWQEEINAQLNADESSQNQVQYMKTDIKSLLPEYCFRGHYILTLLNEGYKFKDEDSSWQKINFVNDLEGTEIGWSLGYMISHSLEIPAEKPQVLIALATFILLVILFCVFVLISVGFACHAINSKKPGYKGKYEQLTNYGAV